MIYADAPIPNPGETVWATAPPLTAEEASKEWKKGLDILTREINAANSQLESLQAQPNTLSHVLSILNTAKLYAETLSSQLEVTEAELAKANERDVLQSSEIAALQELIEDMKVSTNKSAEKSQEAESRVALLEESVKKEKAGYLIEIARLVRCQSSSLFSFIIVLTL